MKKEETRRFIPKNDYVLVEKLKKEERSEGGIIITRREDQPGDMTKARVVAVGPGRPNNRGVLSPVLVKPGDLVLIPPIFTGLNNEKKRTNLLSEDSALLRAEEIIGILEEA